MPRVIDDTLEADNLTSAFLTIRVILGIPTVDNLTSVFLTIRVIVDTLAVDHQVRQLPGTLLVLLLFDLLLVLFDRRPKSHTHQASHTLDGLACEAVSL